MMLPSVRSFISSRVDTEPCWVIRKAVIGWLLLSLAFFLTACQDNNPAGQPSATNVPTQVDQSLYWEAWSKSPHAHTYDWGKGPNTYCSRCHSPRNWDPEASIDDPPNCVTCKFNFDAQLRIAEHNPLVPVDAWLDIRCDVCHRMTAGLASEEMLWWDQTVNNYQAVASSTTLCEKCHTDTGTIRHQRDLGSDAHADYECTQCHDAHSAAASCTQSDCHSSVMEGAFTPASSEMPEYDAMHDLAHATLACVACHDALGLEVGPLEDGTVWVTWRTIDLLGRSTTKPYQSHAIQRQVDCERCHFPSNPWSLSSVEQ